MAVVASVSATDISPPGHCRRPCSGARTPYRSAPPRTPASDRHGRSRVGSDHPGDAGRCAFPVRGSGPRQLDWETPEQIKDKMDEEWNELQEGLANKDEKNVEEELGDFLFVTAQFVRKLGYNPEIILQKANEKFTNRLHGVEELAQKDQKSMQDCTVDELEQYWSQIKMK